MNGSPKHRSWLLSSPVPKVHFQPSSTPSRTRTNPKCVSVSLITKRYSAANAKTKAEAKAKANANANANAKCQSQCQSQCHANTESMPKQCISYQYVLRSDSDFSPFVLPSLVPQCQKFSPLILVPPVVPLLVCCLCFRVPS